MKQPAKYSVLGLILAALAYFFGLWPEGATTAGGDAAQASEQVAPPTTDHELGSEPTPSASTPPATPLPQPELNSKPPQERVAEKPAPSAYPSHIGWTSAASLRDHFEKHGAEFGEIDQAGYLRLAKELRDAKVGGDVLEAIRPGDGKHTRYHRKHGSFIVFTEEGLIITFFKPNDGEAYFKRQIDKEH